MKRYQAPQIRNVVLAGHGGVGKTQLAEAMLFATGALSRMGKVDEGNTVSDWDPEEVKRHISIGTSLIPCEWKDHKVNVLDTPGYFDFVGEVQGALHAADAMLCVMCAAAGVEVGTEKAWAMAEEHGIPRAFFVNRMDRENANFERAVTQLREMFGNKVVPLQVPIGQADTFQGFVDLVEMQAYTRSSGGLAPAPIPDDVRPQAETMRDWLIEAVAATDDELTLKYLEEEEITAEELRGALGGAVRSGQVVPVWLGSALATIGVEALLDGIVSLFPSPAEARTRTGEDPRSGEPVSLSPDPAGPLAALVFKTISDPYVGRLTLFRVVSGTFTSDGTAYNVNKDREERIGQLFVLRGKEQLGVTELGPGDIGAVSKLQATTTGDTLTRKDRPVRLPGIAFEKPNLTLALVPKAKGDEEKIGAALARLQEEDPTFAVDKNAETGQLLVSGLGDVHLEIITSRLQKKFGVEVELVPPRVPYRETIRSTVQVEGKHKKQTGGRGQYGHVILELSPLPPGAGFEFEDKIFGGAVPKQYIPAVEKGARETMEEGVLAGYPVVDVKVTLLDGSYHSVDSSEMAFKIATSMAFKKGFMQAQPVLLEPIMLVEVTVPERYMGDVIGDLNKKRGRILGMDPVNGNQVIRAHVPMAEMVRFAVDLRSMTQGRGSFRAQHDHYEEVPEHLAQAIIAAANANRAS